MTPLPADLILYPVTPRSALSSRLVAAGELLFGAGKGVEGYSHVAILATSFGHQYQYEAKWPRTGRYRIDSSRPYEIWRIKGLTGLQRQRILWWCEDHAGELYDLICLCTFGLIQSRHAAVCSQWAGRAYLAADVRIGQEGKPILSPNAIPDDRRAVLIERHIPR